MHDKLTRDMATATEYTAEQLNYYRICYVTTDVLSEGLRTIFKQEWDSRYKATMGEWKDEPWNGTDFYNAESPRNQRRHAHLLATMVNGDRAEWDCTMLFYAILYSDCIYGLNAVVKSNVDDLRKFRNEEFAHMPQGQLSDVDFKSAMSKVFGAFHALGLSTVQIQQVTNQTTFPTDELKDVLSNVQDLKKDLQEREKENEDLKDQLKQNEDQRRGLKDQLKETEEQRNGLEDRIKETEEQRQGLEDQLKKTEKQRQGLESQIKETEEKQKALEDQLQKTEEQRQGLENQIKDTEEKRKGLEYKLKNTERQRRGLEDQLHQKEEQRKGLEDKLKETGEQRERLKNQLQEKEKQVKDLEDQLNDTEEQRQVFADQLHSDTPQFCILPPKPSHDVADRDAEVASIIQQLKELKQANESSLTHLYISGNPGSGKSQLAGLVVKRFYKDIQEDSSSPVFVMTLNAETLDTLLESYIFFARQMKCPEYAVTNIHTSKDLNIEEKINSLISLISTKIGRYVSWLLVADNVRSLSQMHAHLPQLGHEQWARGQLVITTQDATSIPLTSSSIQHISVSEGMRSKEATSLLAMISGISDSEMVEKVAEGLDYQPLALASAATYVKQIRQSKRTADFGWNDFLKKVETGQRSTTETLLAETNPCYKKSMTAATTLAVKEVMKSDKVIDHTFSLLSLCAPQPLTVDIVVNYIVNVHDEMKDRETIIMKLQRCSLLLLNEEESNVYICAHQVVHDVIKSVIKDYPETVHLKAVNGTISAFHQFIQDNLPKNWGERKDSVMQSYNIAKHLQTCVLSFENLLSKEILSYIVEPEIRELARVCEDYCYFQAAKKYYQYSLEACLNKFAPEHVGVTTSYNNLGGVHDTLGDFEQAKEYQELALNIRQEKLEGEHVDVATSYNDLGRLHWKLGNFEQAKEYHELALNIRQQKLGAEHVDGAASYNNLGLVHWKLGNFEQAKEYHELALNIRQNKLGAEHVDVATSYNNLGLVHKELGDYEQAKEYYHRDLAISLKQLGPEHVDVATSYNNLGRLHWKLGNFEQAKEYHELALNIRQNKLGAEHVDVATSYNNLGLVHGELGNYEQAKEYYHRDLAISLKQLGPEHVDVATSYNNLGLVHKELGDYEQAKEYYHRDLAISLKQLGPEHVDVATSYNNLGLVHKELGDYEQAKEYYHRDLAISLKQLGPEHVDVATSYNNLSLVHWKLGNFEQAKEYHQLALNIRQKRLGPEHVDVATS